MDRAEAAEQHIETVSIEEHGIDFFDILLVLSENRRIIAIFVLIASLLGAAISFSIKPTFSASALILPPQQGQSLSSSMMGQLGALASLTGGALKTPADMYIGILESRTIADGLIDRFHLQDVYKTKKIEDARTSLKSNTRFLTAKDGMIHIIVEDHDPNRASDLANAYVDELYAMNSHLAISEAAQRRVFFNGELTNEQNALFGAENDLKQMEEKTGVFQLGGQAMSIISRLAQLRAEIVSREVQIQSMRAFATDQNPEIVRAQEGIASLREQLALLENDPRNAQLSSVGLPAGQVPQVSLEYARKLRDVKFHEALFELLSKQYEAARIDELKAAPIIQVVDRAVPSGIKSAPHRTMITLGFGFIGFCMGCLWAAITQVLHRLTRIPEYANKLDRLRSGFRASR